MPKCFLWVHGEIFMTPIQGVQSKVKSLVHLYFWGHKRDFLRAELLEFTWTSSSYLSNKQTSKPSPDSRATVLKTMSPYGWPQHPHGDVLQGQIRGPHPSLTTSGSLRVESTPFPQGLLFWCPSLSEKLCSGQNPHYLLVSTPSYNAFSTRVWSVRTPCSNSSGISRWQQ